VQDCVFVPVSSQIGSPSKAQALVSEQIGAPQAAPSATQRPLAQQPTVHVVPPQQASPGFPQGGDAVVLVVVLVVVVVGCDSGAQSSLAATRFTVLLPNWSWATNGGNAPASHLTL
jgi:hypothetical protein